MITTIVTQPPNSLSIVVNCHRAYREIKFCCRTDTYNFMTRHGSKNKLRLFVPRRVMTASQNRDSALEPTKKIFSEISASQSKVGQMINYIIVTNMLVPSPDHLFVHFINRRERPVAVFDYISMAKISQWWSLVNHMFGLLTTT